MKKRDIILIAAVLLIAVGCYFAFARRSETPKTEEAKENAWIAVYVGNSSTPYKLLRYGQDAELTIDQGDGKVNVVKVTKDGGVHMESSTCENQDCVHQGDITLENMNDRALFNWIVCLPNGVAIELLEPEEDKQ